MKARRRVTIDHDTHGPALANLQLVLMRPQVPDVDVLGICMVRWDGW